MAPTKLRNLGKMVGPIDGTRTLVASIMDRGVIAALDDWRKTGLGGVVVGALALELPHEAVFRGRMRAVRA